MQLPNLPLPTDNLYKFCALTGLLGMVLILYLNIKKIDQINSIIDNSWREIRVSGWDSLYFSEQYKYHDERELVIKQFLAEKYGKDVIFLFDTTKDTLSNRNIFFSIVLRHPELIEQYKLVEESYRDFHKAVIDAGKAIEIIESNRQIVSKYVKTRWLIILFSSMAFLLSFSLSIYGFIKWYYKIQIFQDRTLKESVKK